MEQTRKSATPDERGLRIPRGLPLDRLPPALNTLVLKAERLHAQGRSGEAIEVLRDVLEERPDHILALEYFGVISRDLRDYARALEFFDRVVALAPDYGRGHAKSASVQILLQDEARARAALDEALRLDPQDSYIHEVCGIFYSAIGDKEAAREHYRASWTLDPENPLALCNWIDSGGPGQDEISGLAARLESFARQGSRYPPSTRQAVLHTLFRLRERAKDYDGAFACVSEGAGLARSLVSYDLRKTVDQFSYLCRFFNQGYMSAHGGEGFRSAKPVFVLGMPRSGTTLVEQILHSHPDIVGIGEDPALENLVRERPCLPASGALPPPLPKAGLEKKPISFAEFGKAYVDFLESRAPGAARVVNKSMATHSWVGLLELCLPDSKIVYCRRDPLDCCLSCYTHHFQKDAQLFSYDLTELGIYFRAHCELMAYWKELLPHKVLEVRYEDVVLDMEAQTRKILDFLEMPWSDRCLSFHETRKMVVTASIDQVRKPIYGDSVGRWKPYGKHLIPLIRALGPLAPPEARQLLSSGGS